MKKIDFAAVQKRCDDLCTEESRDAINESVDRIGQEKYVLRCLLLLYEASIQYVLFATLTRTDVVPLVNAYPADVAEAVQARFEQHIIEHPLPGNVSYTITAFQPKQDGWTALVVLPIFGSE